ncbi:MAG: EamA family transporter RarD [Devosia sp.]|uniref:EamA family transporter RarD n=1 Tax=Devosia sp. TaxID=1871048 RepID=UPI001A36807E|nr:EamA family transporter RarD [Devosia sp.]MBL8597901.1 EamA family transporter RarD [Devosia sp.]
MATPETTIDEKAAARDAQSGLIVGLVCYLLWGFLPLLFHALQDVGAVTIVADRTIASLFVVGAILLLRNRMSEVAAALRDPQTLRSMVISSVLLAANWLIFVWAVEQNQVLEASFGYFINPLVNVAIGMVLLGERQNPWQWTAIGVAILAIVIQAVGVGRFPWIAVSLALTFGFYGYFRKTAKVGSASGLFVETLILTPLAIAYLAYTFIRDGGVGLHADPYHFFLLLLTGPATAAPLLMFAYAVQRLRLTTIGMLQYLSPSIAFLLAITAFGEPINPVRLLSFGLIWLSLAIYSADSFMRRGRAA